MSHHTQLSRGKQVSKVRDLIIQTGGLTFIEKEVGINVFVDYVADEIDCTREKAMEYVRTCKRGAIARARIQSLKPRVNDAKTPTRDHEKEEE